MKKTYRKHSPAFKTKVVLEALKERETLSELGHRFELHPTQIAAWKKEFLNGAEQVFAEGPVVDSKAHEQEKTQLHQQIGELTVTVNWLKKKFCDKLGATPEAYRSGSGQRPVEEGPVDHRQAMPSAGDPPQRAVLHPTSYW